MKTYMAVGNNELKRSFRVLLVCALLSVCGFGVYFNSMEVPFYFDDLNNIVQNEAVHVDTLTIDDLYQAAFESHIRNRPVANITLALNYFFDGFFVQGYHLVNIFIHIINSILVFFLMRATLESPYFKGQFNNVATLSCLVAVLWLVHPLNSQSVTYIIQRMNSLATLFYLFSFLLYLKCFEESGRWYRGLLLFAATFSWLLGLGSKEIAITLPFFVVLYRWYFFEDLKVRWLQRYLFPLGIALIVVALFGLASIDFKPIEFIAKDFAHRDFTLGQRLLTEFRVVLHYVSLAVFPYYRRLHLDYNFPLSSSLLDPVSTILAIGSISALLLFSLVFAQRYRLLSFSILWFFGNLFLESSFLALEIVYEHRTYLPLIFFFAVPVLFAFRCLTKRYALIVTLFVALLFSFWTYQRNNMWADPVAFWEHNIQQAPLKPRPLSELGMVYGKKGDLPQAESYFKQALQLDPGFVDSYNNLGTVAAIRGEYNTAVVYFKKSVALKPYKEAGQLNLGRVLLQLDLPGEAVAPLLAATRLMPNSSKTRFLLGRAYLQSGQFNRAVETFSKVLEEDPDNATVQKYFRLAREGRRVE